MTVWSVHDFWSLHRPAAANLIMCALLSFTQQKKTGGRYLPYASARTCRQWPLNCTSPRHLELARRTNVGCGNQGRSHQEIYLSGCRGRVPWHGEGCGSKALCKLSACCCERPASRWGASFTATPPSYCIRTMWSNATSLDLWGWSVNTEHAFSSWHLVLWHMLSAQEDSSQCIMSHSKIWMRKPEVECDLRGETPDLSCRFFSSPLQRTGIQRRLEKASHRSERVCHCSPALSLLAVSV